jgi:hypothetical protein
MSDDPNRPVRVSRLTWLRWRLADLVEEARLRVGARIAGVNPEEWRP